MKMEQSAWKGKLTLVTKHLAVLLFFLLDQPSVTRTSWSVGGWGASEMKAGIVAGWDRFLHSTWPSGHYIPWAVMDALFLPLSTGWRPIMDTPAGPLEEPLGDLSLEGLQLDNGLHLKPHSQWERSRLRGAVNSNEWGQQGLWWDSHGSDHRQ